MAKHLSSRNSKSCLRMAPWRSSSSPRAATTPSTDCPIAVTSLNLVSCRRTLASDMPDRAITQPPKFDTWHSAWRQKPQGGAGPDDASETMTPRRVARVGANIGSLPSLGTNGMTPHTNLFGLARSRGARPTDRYRLAESRLTRLTHKARRPFRVTDSSSFSFWTKPRVPNVDTSTNTGNIRTWKCRNQNPAGSHGLSALISKK
jgi:hypothetical protein